MQDYLLHSSLHPPLTFQAPWDTLQPVGPEAHLQSDQSSAHQSSSTGPFGTDLPHHRSSRIPSNPFDPSISLDSS
ncbi:hypothetical protein CROQUDRAFT_92426 [Cronartium quercuum f. sp. fusiforme G11]|uniref:Uncharacterized protein n=1 Tax=Cronartium quercuum f. sp. fusiforme G11 TaxID=708437 RepID=A0A9P6NLZ9_9BASI|nr:hypothetical protein CROQUDRAFT_92426 [Cronartium quercuum f. sp. fusiforme G11]